MCDFLILFQLNMKYGSVVLYGDSTVSWPGSRLPCPLELSTLKFVRHNGITKQLKLKVNISKFKQLCYSINQTLEGELLKGLNNYATLGVKA